MRIAVYTSNQPRHVRLIERIAEIADRVHAVIECSTLFPGAVEDFYRKSQPMQAYFLRVMGAEKRVFGGPRFLPENVHAMPMRLGDLNSVDMEAMASVLECDLHVVFGASYIKSPLVDQLVERRALNIHMGVSPYYRGSGCNFWAIHDGNPDLVGATIHLLTKGLDSGPMLFHALAPHRACDPFELGMLAVDASQTELVRAIRNGTLHTLQPIKQDKGLEIRYSRYADFTDDVVAKYLASIPTAEEIGKLLLASPRRRLIPLAP